MSQGWADTRPKPRTGATILVQTQALWVQLLGEGFPHRALIMQSQEREEGISV